MTKNEINKIIESTKAPEGIMIQGDNGKLYFLDVDQEKKCVLHPSEHQIKLRDDVLKKIGSRGKTVEPDVSFCGGLEGWLTKHSIFTDGWGDIARWYLDEC